MTRYPATLLILALVMAVPVVAQSEKKARGSKTWTWTFQADTLGQAPGNTSILGGRWEVAADSTGARPDGAAASDSAGLPLRVLRQVESDDGLVFHYIRFHKPELEDMAASVRFRIVSGEIDPSAGLVIQLDSKGRNGYVIRASGDKEELILHYLLYGKRRDLRSASIKRPEPGTWHLLEVERKGSILTARYDGGEPVRIRDERFRKGTVGLWTEDDTVVEFADLRVSTR